MKNVLGTRHSLRATRKLTIIAQDPSVKVGGKILRAVIDVPAEELTEGPCGYRVNVIDYDATANALYQPLELGSGLEAGAEADKFRGASDDRLLSDPRLHAQNVYAITMRVLARFEQALGRRVPWGSVSHQLHVAPHAFADANAFYSREDRGLFFGYFTATTGAEAGKRVCTCLAHDIVAHETTHAILDGLRRRYLEAPTLDQLAFHEGFSDVVALLSVFSLNKVVDALLDGQPNAKLIDRKFVTRKALERTALFGLAEEMGEELTGVRGDALRMSIALQENPGLLDTEEFREPHRRGEVLVAAMMRAFLDIWVARIKKLGTIADGKMDREMVVEEGAKAAEHLLTMAIRAIDYCPPAGLTFSSYLSALLTVDREVVPDDGRYGYRAVLLKDFEAFGIRPTAHADEDGTWGRCTTEMVYSRTHFDSMLRDREEMFRFVWENRKALEIGELGTIEVQSVRPSTRIAPDGFVLRETIAEYVQTLTMQAGEWKNSGVDVPEEIDLWRNITLVSGGTLVFDEYGQLKYQIADYLLNVGKQEQQGQRIAELFRMGQIDRPLGATSRLAELHMARSAIPNRLRRKRP